MITKKQFITIITAIEEQHKLEQEFADALDKILDGNFVPMLSANLENSIMTVVKELFEDNADWISWWMYEKDFGKRKDMSASYKNGKKIKLDTVDDLYKFLIKNKKE